MKFTKYSKRTDIAMFNTLRIDYGVSKRIELSCALLNLKGAMWGDGKGKSKLIRVDKELGLTQLGLYIGRLALVSIVGTTRKGM